MWIKGATRKELLDIIQAQGLSNLDHIRQADSLSSALDAPHELYFIWRENPAAWPILPSAILIDQNKRRDFLAWVWTYLQGFRHFTAYCRIVDTTIAETSLKRNGIPSLGKLENACLGLILGEAASYIEGRLDLRQLSPAACANTYSFAMAKALSLKILSADIEDPISSTWAKARSLTKQPKLSLTIDAIQEFWAVVLSLASNGALPAGWKGHNVPQSVMDACIDLYTSSEIRQGPWNNLTRGFPEISGSWEQMRGPREERIVALERALATLAISRWDRSAHPLTAAFLCGYLTSQVAPGTIDHISLLIPHLSAFPTVLLWYGFCAGLQDRSDLQSYAGGLGRRVMREVLRSESILDRPRCDIAVAELEIVMGGENAPLEFCTGNRGHLEIEIAPCVTTVVRWPAREDTQVELFPTKSYPPEVRELIGELDKTLSHADAISEKLASLFGGYDGLPVESNQKSRKGRRREKWTS